MQPTGSQRQRPHARGFTLPELLVVVAIIALTVIIAIPTFSGLTQKNGLRAGARELSATLNEARRRAIAERTAYAVVIDCNLTSGVDTAPIPVTRFWLARFDDTFDPAVDATDLADSDSLAPFDGEFTKFEQTEDPRELPDNITVVATRIQNTGFGLQDENDDYVRNNGTARFRINAVRTEDFNLNGGVSDVEDVGVDGFSDGNGAIGGRNQAGFEAVDPGEDDDADDDEVGADEDIDSVYRIIRFGPQGNADRASIVLWDATDGRTPMPATAAVNAPASLRALGLPPGMNVTWTLHTTVDDQRDYFTVVDQTQDVHYYTIDVNPTTGKVTVYDYARGTGTVGTPPEADDWNRAKDGES